MSASALSHHPAPQRARLPPLEALFLLTAPPIAWFVQLCVGYTLASAPCFAAQARRLQVPASAAWTRPAMVIALLVALLICLYVWLRAWRVFTATRNEQIENHGPLIESGSGRTRFVALWGMLLGTGFAVATVVTAVAFAVLPRCLG